MNDLSERTRAALRALDDDHPAPEDLARIERGLALRLAALAPVAGASAAAKTGLTAKAALSVKVVAAVIVVAGAGAVISRTQRSTPHPAVAAPERALVRPAPEPSTGPVVPEVPIEEPAPRPARAPAPPLVRPRASTVVAPRETPEPEPAQKPSAPTLGDELSLLQEARRALSREDFSRVLELVEEHRQKFPHGMLSRERDALEVRARCDGGESCAADDGTGEHRPF